MNDIDPREHALEDMLDRLATRVPGPQAQAAANKQAVEAHQEQIQELLLQLRQPGEREASSRFTLCAEIIRWILYVCFSVCGSYLMGEAVDIFMHL